MYIKKFTDTNGLLKQHETAKCKLNMQIFVIYVPTLRFAAKSSQALDVLMGL